MNFFVCTAVSELSKMYPTPPSNNTSNDRSPGPHDVMDNHISLEKQVIKTEFIHAIKEDFFRVKLPFFLSEEL